MQGRDCEEKTGKRDIPEAFHLNTFTGKMVAPFGTPPRAQRITQGGFETIGRSMG
jgi:hypothetical protein